MKKRDGRLGFYSRVGKETAIKELLQSLTCSIKENDHEILVGGAQDVYSKLKQLSEPLSFKEVDYPMNVDTQIYMKKEKLNIEVSLNELIILLDKFIKINEFAKIQFKS